MTRVTVSHEFELEVEVIRPPKSNLVVVVVTEVDSDGGIWHYPKDIDESGEGIATFSAGQVAGLTDDEIIAKARVQG